MKGAYPIVKYPIGIERKLKERSSVPLVAGETEDNPFDFLFPPVTRRPATYPVKILWSLLGFWLLVLCGVVFKLVPATGFVAAIVITVVGVGIALRQMWIDSKITAKKIDRAKALPTPNTKPKPPSTAIDWSDNVRELVRSNQKSTAQVGVSEEHFMGYMLKSLPGQISFGHVYLPEGYSHPYSADIEIILPNGLGIQVEIDEPYVGKTREPHHCWDNDKDTKRDRYFLEQGWIIIRFSERQVVVSPKECCGFIAEVIFGLTQSKSLVKLSQLAKKLEPDPQWSAQQSQLMEKLKTREKYLGAAGLWNDRRKN